MRCGQSSCAIIGRQPELRRRCAEAHAKSNRAKDKSLSQRRRSCASCSLGVPPQHKHKINHLLARCCALRPFQRRLLSAAERNKAAKTLWGRKNPLDRFLPMTSSPHSFGRTEFSAPQTHAGIPGRSSAFRPGVVTLPCRGHEVSTPQELSGRCNCGPPRGHRVSAKYAMCLS